jgi:hypothetical protein
MGRACGLVVAPDRGQVAGLQPLAARIARGGGLQEPDLAEVNVTSRESDVEALQVKTEPDRGLPDTGRPGDERNPPAGGWARLDGPLAGCLLEPAREARPVLARSADPSGDVAGLDAGGIDAGIGKAALVHETDLVPDLLKQFVSAAPAPVPGDKALFI